MDLIFYIALSLTFFCVIALLVAPILLRPSRGARHILEIVQSNRPDERKIGTKERAQEKVLLVARAFRARVGMAEDEKLKQRFLSAGLRSGGGMDLYFTARFLCPLAGIVCGSFNHGNTLMWCLCLGVIGYMIPDFWLGHLGKGRQKRIQKSIPDAIDLMVICVDAGLGLDQALLRVGQELAISHPELNEEFMQINLEQRAGKPRLEAWQSMADRTKIPEFAELVNMLIQTDRFGTPIIRALSRFAEEIRTRRRQRAEEAAAKTKIKILFPLVLFIFPCIFIVLLGPAILNLAKNLSALK
ncbi:type II secretion system F family protein [Edaphobacter paludis]|uniref:Type II secretion system F family protein n=1 Tax=Edaphobacter paludis TaxID=3035702 RepID=A0AAU7D1V9_9BACT